jgi:hypothetical protein
MTARQGLRYPGVVMLTLRDDRDASYLEFRRCGELDGGGEDRRVWTTGSCGAGLARSAAPAVREDADRAPPGALC